MDRGWAGLGWLAGWLAGWLKFGCLDLRTEAGLAGWLAGRQNQLYFTCLEGSGRLNVWYLTCLEGQNVDKFITFA